MLVLQVTHVMVRKFKTPKATDLRKEKLILRKGIKMDKIIYFSI